MSRTVIREVAEPRTQRGVSGPVLLGMGIVLLFAVVGVVSAGTFVANKISGSKPAPAAKHTRAAGTAVAVQDIARAQAQASAIVSAAHAAANSIVSRATRRANAQASAIIAGAHRRAERIAASSPPNTSTQASAPATNNTTSPSSGTTAPSGTTSGGSGATVASGASGSGTGVSGSSTGTGATASSIGTTPSTTQNNGAGQITSSPPSATADLSGVPASWRVVGYNASFGRGSGGVGSITVTNRGYKTYSGVARVVYAGGGSASASFSGLAPGQTEVLPLNGSPYSGGGYQIEVNVG